MRFRELFALGVRLFGIWLITRGVTYVAAFLDVKLYPLSDKARDSATANLIYATLDFALASFFLLWTRVIVAWTYGEQRGMAEVKEAGIESGTGTPVDNPEGHSTP
jgi:hypothetical protein